MADETLPDEGEQTPERTWVEKPVVTDRPNDLQPGAVRNSTFAERAKAVQSAENKAVMSEETKSPKKAARKKP